MLTRTLALGCLLLITTASSGQDLSGTWVGDSSGGEHTNTHQGDTITGTAWGGAADPELKGTLTLKGGPTIFRGTWENGKPGWTASGSIVYHVVDKDTILIAYAGTVVNAGNKVTFSYAERLLRKGAAAGPTDLAAGKWTFTCDRVGSSTWIFTPRDDGTYDVTESGLGQGRGTATLVNDKLTIVATSGDGRYAATTTFTMNGRSGVGKAVWTKKPEDESRVSPFDCTLTFVPAEKQ